VSDLVVRRSATSGGGGAEGGEEAGVEAKKRVRERRGEREEEEEVVGVDEVREEEEEVVGVDEVGMDWGETGGEREGGGEVVINRGLGTRPVLVRLMAPNETSQVEGAPRGEEYEGGEAREGYDGAEAEVARGGGEEEGWYGEDAEWEETLLRLPAWRRRALVEALQRGVPGMVVGEVVCVLSEMQDAGVEGATSLSGGREGLSGEGRGRGTARVQQRSRMLQVEVELLAVGMECITPDGGILASIHRGAEGESAGAGEGKGEVKGEGGDGPLVGGARQEAEVGEAVRERREEGSRQGLAQRARPGEGDVAVVSYKVWYRGEELLDQSEPHEVKLRGWGGAKDQEWDVGAGEDGLDLPPGVRVLLLGHMSLGDVVRASLEGRYALGDEGDEGALMGCGERLELELRELPLRPRP
jgi:hypothetical protein